MAVEGASISMSRWNNSHQKGVESMERVYVLVMAWMVCACSRRKFERLRFLRWRRHVFRKSGGWWSVCCRMKGMPRCHRLCDPFSLSAWKMDVPMSRVLVGVGDGWSVVVCECVGGGG